MKLLCDTSIHYRQAAGAGAASSSGRPQKSTLALGTHPPNAADAELFLLLFTPACKTGQRYRVRDNIERVFTKFVADGKCTVSLKQPAHDLQIRCDAVQLRGFLQALKLGFDGRHSPVVTSTAKPVAAADAALGQPAAKLIKLGTLATTAIPKSAQPVTKLVVRSRGDYPVRGLPRTLRHLQVNGVQRARFDTQILALRSLTTLNLNDNALSELPAGLGQLPLQQLDVGRNRLGAGSRVPSAWRWLEGEPLRGALHTLVLAGNGLEQFPFAVVQLRRLAVLKLEDNRLERMPFAVRRMRALKHLHLANNRFASLPSTVSLLGLHTIDLSGNRFATDAHADDDTDAGGAASHQAARAEVAQRLTAVAPPQLWELAARRVAASRLPYGPRSMPAALIELLEGAPLCACGALCFTAAVCRRSQRVRLRAEHVIWSGTGGGVGQMLFDAAYCSRRCLVKYAVPV